MTTVGWKKPECKRGHVAPLRNSHGACIQCAKAYRKERYLQNRERYIRLTIERQKANPEARRDHGRAQRIGVPVAQVRAAIAAAGGMCEACSKPVTHASLVVDHCHVTGLVRGVLCRFCNALEGILNKNADRIEQIRAYLSREIAKREQSQPANGKG